MPIQNLSSAEIIKFHEAGFKTSPAEESSIFGKDGFSFGDILDIINPLQHIPVVNSLYRKLTGDTIAPAMQIAGDALFGGPIGAAISLVTTTIKSQFNRDDVEPNQTSHETTALASNASQTLPKTISIGDYSVASNLKIDPSTNTYQTVNNTVNRQVSGSIGPAIANDSAKHVSYKDAEKYNDVISATNPTENNINVVIGSQVDAG